MSAAAEPGPSYSIDPLTQREVLTDPADAAAWVRTLEARGEAADPMRVAWLRMLGRLPEAADLGWRVLARAGGPAQPSAVTALPLPAVTAALRLAHVLQWQRDFDGARALFHLAFAALDGIDPASREAPFAATIRPFAHQHLAKCLFEEGKLAAAMSHAELALLLRQDSGAGADLIASSAALVEAIHTRAGHPG